MSSVPDCDRIIGLQFENFKRLKVVRIRPHHRICQLVGPNGAGKTSVLDGIWATLGGASAQPEEPIRKGADRATLRVETERYIVERVYTGAGKSYLKVSERHSPADRKGTTLDRPQTILDQLVDGTQDDPLQFIRQKPKEQAETIRKILGIDNSDLDAKRAEIFEDRRQVNASIKQQEGQLAGIPDDPEAPDEEVSIDQLLIEGEKARQTIEAGEQARDELARHVSEFLSCEQRIAELQAELADAMTARQSLADAIEQQGAIVADLDPDPDVDSITQRIRDVGSLNTRARSKRERQSLLESLASNRQHSQQLTEQLSDITAQIADRLRNAMARIPIQGLALEDDRVTLDGIPISQLSHAQKYRFGLAIAVARDPKLRFATIREASLIDDAGMALLDEWAAQNRMQLFLEVVGDASSETGVIIEDGEVLEDRQSKTTKPKAPKTPAPASLFGDEG